MVGIVDLFTGFEVEQIPTVATAGGVTSRLTLITGWAWWMLTSCNFTVNNLGGAAVVSPLLTVHISNNTVVYTTTPGGQVAIGAITNIEFGLLVSQAGVVGTGMTGSLPFVPILGEGDVTYGYTGGDVATVLTAGMLVIVGRRQRNKK